MASSLPLGEKTAAVLDVVNREEITSCFCYWTEEALSIYQVLARSPFCREFVPQAEQFHICPATTA